LPKNIEAPLLVELKPSERLKWLLIVIHMLALGSSLANALPTAAKLVLLIGICMHLWFIIRRFKNESFKIKHTEALGWAVLPEGSGSNHDFEPIQILNSTVITVFAIFLHFNKNAHKQSVLIINDALSEDDYRRLIVRLKTAGKN
jgi:toxin CptA